MSRNFHGFTELLRIHGSVLKSRNFPDFRTITELLRIHGPFTDSGITEGFNEFGNVRSIVDIPCNVKRNHGKATELSRKIHGTSRGS